MIRYRITNRKSSFQNMSKQQEIQSQLLQLLLRYGTITRPQCIQELGVRPGTLLEAINALKTRGLVQEPSRHSRRTGRKAPELELVPDCLWCAGLEVRADGIQGVVVDATGVVQESCFVPCDFHQNSSDYLQKLFLAVETLVSAANAGGGYPASVSRTPAWWTSAAGSRCGP